MADTSPWWLWDVAIRGVRGDRPLGDISPGQETFGPFLRRVVAARGVTEAGTLGTVPFPSSPPLVPVPGLPGSPPPPSVPGRPGGSSIPDRIGGRPASIAGLLGSILRGGWVGALFYPSANPGGASSALCVETEYGPWCPPGLPNVAAPAPGVLAPGRGRRRPRAVPGAPGRRRPRARPIAQPIGPPRPRGRPVTLSRPRVEVRPDVAAAVRTPPRPAQPPIPASIPQAQEVSLPSSGTIAAPRPATVPAASSAPSSALPALASVVLPALGAWVSSFTGPTVGAVTGPTVGTRLGTIPLGDISPGGNVAPGVQPLPSPLTAFNAAPATSASRDLDEQCRARARARRKKRKPRTVCYRGTYVEKRNGTIKRRKEKVRCQ